MSKIDEHVTPPAPEVPAEALTEEAARQAELAVPPEIVADSVGDYLRTSLTRIRAGESGVLPVVGGLILISILFQSLNSHFLTAGNLVNLLVQAAVFSLLAMGEVFVLILGEIDLSVGFVAALGAVIMADLAGTSSRLALVGGDRRRVAGVCSDRDAARTDHHPRRASVVRGHARRPPLLAGGAAEDPRHRRHHPDQRRRDQQHRQRQSEPDRRVGRDARPRRGVRRGDVAARFPTTASRARRPTGQRDAPEDRRRLAGRRGAGARLQHRSRSDRADPRHALGRAARRRGAHRLDDPARPHEARPLHVRDRRKCRGGSPRRREPGHGANHGFHAAVR